MLVVQRLSHFTFIAAATLAWPTDLLAADPADPTVDSRRDTTAGDENAQKRMQFMVDAFEKYKLTYVGERAGTAKLRPQPVLRWSNPVSGTKDGCLVVFTRGGRPDVIGEFQIHSESAVIHEFSPIAWEELQMSREDRTVWKPESGWFEFKELPGAPAPAANAAGRLVQMRRLANRFSVFDEFGWREEEIKRHPLRLLSQPVYRYEEPGDVIDGAVFIFALATDTECALLLEAYKNENGTGWRYGVVPTTIYELEVYLDGDGSDGELVWSKPRYMKFVSANGPYHVGPYRVAPDDISLKGSMPKD
jgi:hypothetical protein